MTEITYAFDVLSDGSMRDTISPLIRPAIVPEGKRIAFVLRNFERPPYVSRPTMNGNRSPFVKSLPDTCPFPGSSKALLGKEQQEFWFELLVRCAPSSVTLVALKKAWASLTADDRAFTNGAGSYTRADYINKTNLDAGPMRFITMATGGAILDIVGGPFQSGGVQCWQVKTINVAKLIGDPFTVFWATVSARDGYNIATRKWSNEKIEQRFPQLNGNNVPVPVFSSADAGLIPCDRVRVLNAGDVIPSPYT